MTGSKRAIAGATPPSECGWFSGWARQGHASDQSKIGGRIQAVHDLYDVLAIAAQTVPACGTLPIRKRCCACYRLLNPALQGRAARGRPKAKSGRFSECEGRLLHGPAVAPQPLCLRGNANHPAQAEAIGQHAEAGRPESLGQRHFNFAAV